MKKIFYPYTFWWLALILFVLLFSVDAYWSRGLPGIRTPSAWLLVPMLFLFGFPHWEVTVLHKMNERLVRLSRVLFLISTLITFCVIFQLISNSYNKWPKLYLWRIFDFLVGIFIALNLIFTVFVLALRFRRK